MRLGLVLAAALVAAHPAAAQDGGPPMLNWANKRQFATPQSRPAMARPEPMALAADFMHGRQSAAPPADLPPPPGDRRVTYQPPAYQPFTPQTPYVAPRPTPAPAPSLEGPPPSPPIYAPLPSSLYSGPPPLPEQAAAPTPQRLAAAASPRVGGSSKLYSLHRGYGLEPDVIPESPDGDRYVFIGPPDEPTAKDSDDKDDTDKDDDNRTF